MNEFIGNPCEHIVEASVRNSEISVANANSGMSENLNRISSYSQSLGHQVVLQGAQNSWEPYGGKNYNG